MAILSQAYEWMNFAIDGDSGAGFHIGRQPNSRPVSIQANQPVDIFTGGIGNNISTQPKVKINEFPSLRISLLCSKRSENINISKILFKSVNFNTA